MPYLESALVTTAAAGAMAECEPGFIFIFGGASHSERLARRQTNDLPPRLESWSSHGR